jgi:hypothetical protein
VGPVLRQERRFGRNRSTLAMRIVCPLFLPPKEAKVTCDQGFGPETSSDDPTGLDDAAHLLAAIECGSGRRRSRRAEPKGRDLELF